MWGVTEKDMIRNQYYVSGTVKVAKSAKKIVEKGPKWCGFVEGMEESYILRRMKKIRGMRRGGRQNRWKVACKIVMEHARLGVEKLTIGADCIKHHANDTRLCNVY